jgi:polysaccharide export outer membrane protein
MNSSFFYIQPNDLIYIKPLKQKSFGTGTTGLQTLTTLVSAFSLIFTTILLIRK